MRTRPAAASCSNNVQPRCWAQGGEGIGRWFMLCPEVVLVALAGIAGLALVLALERALQSAQAPWRCAAAIESYRSGRVGAAATRCPPAAAVARSRKLATRRRK